MTGVIGVYAIIEVGTGRAYVGATQQHYRRWCLHFAALRRGNHSNRALQHAFNSGSELACCVLEQCEPQDALWCEMKWLGRFEHVFNTGTIPYYL